MNTQMILLALLGHLCFTLGFPHGLPDLHPLENSSIFSTASSKRAESWGRAACETDPLDSPPEIELRNLLGMEPYPDGRGFCLTPSALCPGQFNNPCLDNGGRVATIELSRTPKMALFAQGDKRQMQLLCADFRQGLDTLRTQCMRAGRVQGYIQHNGENGKGYVTLHVRRG